MFVTGTSTAVQMCQSKIEANGLGTRQGHGREGASVALPVG